MRRTYLQSVGGHTGMRGATSNKSQRPRLLLLMISLHSLSDLPSHVGVKESLPQILAGQVTRASQKNDSSVTRYSADSDNVQAQCHQECSSHQISCHLQWGEIYALPRMQRNCKTEGEKNDQWQWQMRKKEKQTNIKTVQWSAAREMVLLVAQSDKEYLLLKAKLKHNKAKEQHSNNNKIPPPQKKKNKKKNNGTGCWYTINKC